MKVLVVDIFASRITEAFKEAFYIWVLSYIFLSINMI